MISLTRRVQVNQCTKDSGINWPKTQCKYIIWYFFLKQGEKKRKKEKTKEENKYFAKQTITLHYLEFSDLVS